MLLTCSQIAWLCLEFKHRSAHTGQTKIVRLQVCQCKVASLWAYAHVSEMYEGSRSLPLHYASTPSNPCEQHKHSYAQSHCILQQTVHDYFHCAQITLHNAANCIHGGREIQQKNRAQHEKCQTVAYDIQHTRPLCSALSI